VSALSALFRILLFFPGDCRSRGMGFRLHPLFRDEILDIEAGRLALGNLRVTPPFGNMAHHCIGIALALPSSIAAVQQIGYLSINHPYHQLEDSKV